MRRLHELLDCWVAADPGRWAIHDFDGARYDFAAAGAAVDEAQGHLTGAGVRPGDRVMLVGENSLVLAAFLLACSRLDAWAIPVNARMSRLEIDRIRDHAEPRAMVFTTGSSPAALVHAEERGARPAQMRSGGLHLVPHLPCMPEPCAESPEEQVAALIYTTGTTGEPKGVMLTHGNFLFMADGSMKLRGMTVRDTVLCLIPMTHIFGLASAFLAGLCAGALLRFLPRFEAGAVFQALADGVSVMPAVPQIYALLMQHAETEGWTSAPAPGLKYISAGGAPLDREWKRKVEAFFGITLHNGYGMTEASPGICVTRIGQERDDIACGPPMEGVEVRLIPPPGRQDLSDGVGEILCRGPNVMKGYYKNPEATANTVDAEGWLHTGDLGRFTEDGALTIVGRSKELIVRSGFNVYPPEVEAALTQHPGVAISAVIGRLQQDGNEEILAFIQRMPGGNLDEEGLRDHLKDLVAPYKRPTRFIIADALPAAATGKILKHKLLEVFADELAVTVGERASPTG